MSVIWESKCKMCRRAGTKLFLKGDRCFTKKCAMENRAFPPGQHGPTARDKKLVGFGEQLREKQKLRQMYHLREAQFQKYVVEAQRQLGITGDVLLRLLETRLDNVVYRLGWASARGQSRQIVSHNFVTVNGKRVNIPSYQVRPGDVIGIHESKRDTSLYTEARNRAAEQNHPGWIAYDSNAVEARIARAPEPEDIDTNVDLQKIVEFYSR